MTWCFRGQGGAGPGWLDCSGSPGQGAVSPGRQSCRQIKLLGDISGCLRVESRGCERGWPFLTALVAGLGKLLTLLPAVLSLGFLPSASGAQIVTEGIVIVIIKSWPLWKYVLSP